MYVFEGLDRSVVQIVRLYIKSSFCGTVTRRLKTLPRVLSRDKHNVERVRVQNVCREV